MGRKKGFVSKAVKKAIKRAINQDEEVKYVDTLTSATVANSGTYIVPLADLAQGAAMGQRIGLEAKIKAYKITMSLKENASATNTVYRILIVKDKKPVLSTNIVWTDVVKSAVPHAQYNMDNFRSRFVIYKDIFAGTGISNTNHEYNFRKTFKNGQVQKYTDAATNTQNQGRFYLIAISDEATNVPTLSVSTRVLYTDD